MTAWRGHMQCHCPGHRQSHRQTLHPRPTPIVTSAAITALPLSPSVCAPLRHRHSAPTPSLSHMLPCPPPPTPGSRLWPSTAPAADSLSGARGYQRGWSPTASRGGGGGRPHLAGAGYQRPRLVTARVRGRLRGQLRSAQVSSEVSSATSAGTDGRRRRILLSHSVHQFVMDDKCEAQVGDLKTNRRKNVKNQNKIGILIFRCSHSKPSSKCMVYDTVDMGFFSVNTVAILNVPSLKPLPFNHTRPND